MKALSLVFMITLASVVYAEEKSEKQNEEIKWWRCECSVTDVNRGHYYGASNRSADDAINRAMRNCYTRSQDPGTCQVATYDRCGCN